MAFQHVNAAVLRGCAGRLGCGTSGSAGSWCGPSLGHGSALPLTSVAFRGSASYSRSASSVRAVTCSAERSMCGTGLLLVVSLPSPCWPPHNRTSLSAGVGAARADAAAALRFSSTQRPRWNQTFGPSAQACFLFHVWLSQMLLVISGL